MVATSEKYKIPILRRDSGIPVIEVTINGNLHCEMLLDTGCSDIALPAYLVRELEAPKVGTAQVQSAKGSFKCPIVRLESVSAGGLEVHQLLATSNKSLLLGLLGNTFWGDRSITIHQSFVEIGQNTWDFLADSADERASELGDLADYREDRQRTEKNPQEAHRLREDARRLRKAANRAKERANRLKRDKEAEMPQNSTKRKILSGKRGGISPNIGSTKFQGNRPQRDEFVERQDKIHTATNRAASYLHLVGSFLLGVVMTFFRRTFLSIVAFVVLVGGMLLAGWGYAVSAGFVPQTNNSSVRAALTALVDWFNSAPQFEVWGAVAMVALAIAVQCYQSWSIAHIQSAFRAAKTGGKPGFPNLIQRFLFWAVTGLVWYLDFTAISGVSFAAGVAGFAVWLWAAFPSEISAMILSIQKSAKED